MAVSPTGKTGQRSKNQGISVSSKTLWMGIILLITTGLLALTFFMLRGTPVERGIKALVEATAKNRPIELRLSGGFAAGKYTPSDKDISVELDSESLAQARELIYDAVSEGRDPAAHSALGRLLLIEGKIKDAIVSLNTALEKMPESPEVKNDMGVGLFLDGNIDGAFYYFEEALKLDPDMTEALFNHALCFEKFLILGTARDEFSRVAKIETDKGWPDEINQRLGEINQRIEAVSNPQASREELLAAFDSAMEQGKTEEAEKIADNHLESLLSHAINDISRKYLNEIGNGNNEGAERALLAINIIGARFNASKGDTSIADFAKYLSDLKQGEHIAELNLIDRYIAAENLLHPNKERAGKPSDALSEFIKLREEFEGRGNILFQHFSIFYIAECHNALYDFENSITNHKQGLAIIEKKSWPIRQARSYRAISILHARIGQDSIAINYCEDALQRFEGMHQSQAGTLEYLGTIYWRLGDLDKAIAVLRNSANLFLSNYPSKSRLANIFLTIADSYRLRGNHSLARIYADESLNYSDMEKDYSRAAQASSFTAVELAYLKQTAKAEEYIERALNYIEKSDEKLRHYSESLVWLRAGEIARVKGDRLQAISHYSRAEQVAKNLQDNRVLLLRILDGRSKSYFENEQVEEARKDLERAIGLIEYARSNISERENRSHFLDASHKIFDELININLEAAGRESEAFDVLEQSRGRALLDDFSPDSGTQSKNGSGTPLNLAQVQSELPENLRVLLYSVTDRGTNLFLVTRDEFKKRRSSADTKLIDRLVSEYVSGLYKRAEIDGLNKKGYELHKLLIKPIEKDIGDGKVLCIVPDKALHFLPFAALIDDSGRYLLYSQTITYAPSASVLIRCLEKSLEKKTGRDEKILAVGNPLFDPEEFDDLDNLEDAEREANKISEFYSNSLPLLKEKATKRLVREGLKDCDVAHLALHCIVEAKSPWLAALVLANPDPKTGDVVANLSRGDRLNPDTASKPIGTQRGGIIDNYLMTLDSARSFERADKRTVLPQRDDLLYLNEVYGMSLPRTRLVVLSACQSGLGQYYRGEGMVSLVRPFLALEVPTVVASLWSVDSKATADLMIEFHRQRTVEHKGTGEALQAAQKRMAEIHKHPYFWAPFIVVGSNN